MPHRHLKPQMMYKIDNTDLINKAAAYVSTQDADLMYVEQRIENAYKDAWRQCEKHFGIVDYNDASKTDEKKRCTRHESKGVSDEYCSMRMSQEQGEAYMQEMAAKETKRRKRR